MLHYMLFVVSYFESSQSNVVWEIARMILLSFPQDSDSFLYMEYINIAKIPITPSLYANKMFKYIKNAHNKNK
jgi:hypothetical protein